MPSHHVLPLLACLLLLLGVWLYECSKVFHRPSCSREPNCSHVARCLRPRSPLDCPECCQAALTAVGKEHTCAPMRPWREVKSRRGAHKRINTEGVVCPNRACAYYGIGDAHIHAVVSDGRSGKTERIQRWRCQACQT